MPGTPPPRAWLLRTLVRLLCLMLVPVLVVTAPTVAEAATKAGPSVGFSIDSRDVNDPNGFGGLPPATAVKCTGSASYRVTGDSTVGYSEAIAVAGLQCTDSWFSTLKQLQLRFNGSTPSGGTCTGSISVSTQDSAHLPSSGFSASMNLIPGPASSLCAVGQLCWTASQSYINGGLHDLTGCSTLSMGTPQTPNSGPVSTGCPYFHPTGVSLKREPGSAYGNSQQFVWTYRIYADGPIQNSGRDFRIFAVWKGDDGALRHVQFVGFGTWNAGAGGGWYQGGAWGDQGQNGATGTIKNGIKITDYINPATDGWLATNDPKTCRFYFGDKIQPDDPNSTIDDPAAPLSPYGTTASPPAGGDNDPDPAPTNVAPPQDSCTFKWSDPSTWASGGMCAAVAFLSAIWDTLGKLLTAVGGLAADIAAAIMQGLSDAMAALFVPSHDSVSGFSDSVTESVDGSNYGQWKQAITGFGGGSAGASLAPKTALASPSARTAVASSSAPSFGWGSGVAGCEGIGITWDKLETVGMDPTLHPFAACDGAAANAAGWCRTICLLFILVMGTMKAIQLITEGLGISVNTRILSNNDWSGATYWRN